uniref:Uncharacterized protein n=1 Tax=Kalanchoe fedtschenkoi TaxID=63787 RepID=A0A7N1A1X6_KALFE
MASKDEEAGGARLFLRKIQTGEEQPRSNSKLLPPPSINSFFSPLLSHHFSSISPLKLSAPIHCGNFEGFRRLCPHMKQCYLS